MPQFVVTAESLCVEQFIVEAEDEESAARMVEDGRAGVPDQVVKVQNTVR